MTTALWGQDIALDSTGNPRIAANGEFVLTDGIDTGLQDIRLRLFTRLGALFYDANWGSLIHDWIFDENVAEARMAFEAEVLTRVELDPRVEFNSVDVEVFQWDERAIHVRISWRFIGEDQPLNLILQADKAVRELVVNDVYVAS